MSQFKNELDQATVLREGTPSNRLFDFITTLTSMEELVQLIQSEYPNISAYDLTNRLKIIDIQHGKLSEYARNNGFRFQTVDTQRSSADMQNRGTAVFMIDILRAFGTKQLPGNLKIVDIREGIIMEKEGYQDKYGSMVEAFLQFVREVEALPGESWTHTQLLQLFYNNVWPNLDGNTQSSLRTFEQAQDILRNRLDVQVGFHALPNVFSQFISPDFVGDDFTYLRNKFKEQLDLFVIKKVYNRLKEATGSAPTIEELIKRLDSIEQGNISIIQNYAKYLQVEANSRSVNRNVIDLIDKSMRLANEAA
jgi:hypothetical protein